MNGLSDLELVAQAMGSTDQPQPRQPSQNTAAPQQSSQPPSQPNSTQSPSSSTTQPDLPESTVQTLKSLGIDISSLSAADQASLQPILAALTLDIGQEDGEAGGEEDELKIAELLAQMDAAGEVADDLEDKLDVLLANLGKAEEEMKASLPVPQEIEKGKEQ